MLNTLFKATVNKNFNLNLSVDEIKEITLTNLAKGKSLLNYKLKNYQINLIESDFTTKTYSIEINNNLYQVKLADELDTLISTMGFSSGNTQKLNNIHSPMPGLVLCVNVKVGQKVKEGDVLLILEAMKMENSILAPKDGVVKIISTKINATVEKGEHLIELS